MATSATTASSGKTSAIMASCRTSSRQTLHRTTDGFTSLFEGMPNVVLEISQHAIPMILSDVGGLRETFADSALFVAHQSDSAETASLFGAALDRVAAMDDAAITAMVCARAQRALARHSPAAHACAVAEIFGLS